MNSIPQNFAPSNPIANGSSEFNNILPPREMKVNGIIRMDERKIECH